MLHRTTTAASRTAASQPAISPGNHTSCWRSPNRSTSHGGVLTAIQLLFATRNRPTITPSPIIVRTTVDVATSRSQRITASTSSQVGLEEPRAARHHLDLGVAARERVALVGRDHVLDRDAALAQGLHDDVALA